MISKSEAADSEITNDLLKKKVWQWFILWFVWFKISILHEI